MFKELLEYIGVRIKEVVTSRLFPLGLLFTAFLVVLVVHLYDLQIVRGAEALETYVNQKTLRTVSIDSTRGNIYDRNGTLLAYNELCYSVTLTDTGDYNGYQKNLMLRDLLEILDENDVAIVESLPLIFDSNGTLQYSVGRDDVLRTLRDVYGKRSVQEVLDDDELDENITAEGLFELLYKRYGIGKYGSSASAGTYDISREEALRIMNIRYLLSLNAYQKYKSVVIVKDVDEDTMTKILEHADSLKGVDIEEDYRRVYPDGVYFAHVIGYTGTASAEDLERLNADYAEGEERFRAGDVVGKTGIEASMEAELQGIKGSRTMYLDSVGRILEVTEETEPVTGNDIYLTIDHDLQIGIYHLIEQNLAGILVDKLDNELVYNPAGASASNRRLSIYEAYYQMINNNILDMDRFAEADADSAQHRLYESYLAGQEEAYSAIRQELLAEDPTPYKDLAPDTPENQENFLKIYISYVYEILLENGYLIRSAVDVTDETYIAYKTDETISLKEFLQYAMSENWIDVSKLELSGRYTSAEDTYRALVDRIEELLKESRVFSKRIYKNLIYNGRITGCDVCLALLEQGVIKSDPEAEEALKTGDTVTAYDFMISKIQSLEITPEQLAMDPCSAAVTLVDVNTCETIACVSYPSYDNNKLSGTIDSQYYSQLVNDLSSPLYNTATQAQKAPGSVFKLVTTSAALEEGVVKADDILVPEGVFTKQGLKLACSYYSIHGEPHPPMNIVGAIAQSCNYFFCEMGYRLSLLSTQPEEVYSERLGLETLTEYAERLGLGEKTGIQLAELEPRISDTAPIPSAIGQGNNIFSNVQLARYLATLANGGHIYKLTLLDRLTDKDGTLLQEYEPELVGESGFSESTWKTIHEGMRAVATDNDGTKKNITCTVEIAGKTGTAEENKLRPNHANFIAYAPYNAPEIGVAVTILNGYTASNSVKISSDVFDLYYGQLTLSEIRSRGASQASTSVIYD